MHQVFTCLKYPLWPSKSLLYFLDVSFLTSRNRLSFPCVKLTFLSCFVPSRSRYSYFLPPLLGFHLLHLLLLLEILSPSRFSCLPLYSCVFLILIHVSLLHWNSIFCFYLHLLPAFMFSFLLLCLFMYILFSHRVKTTQGGFLHDKSHRKNRNTHSST